jgi:hypothetical protein
MNRIERHCTREEQKCTHKDPSSVNCEHGHVVITFLTLLQKACHKSTTLTKKPQSRLNANLSNMIVEAQA